MSGKEIATFGGNVLTYVLSAVQENEVLQIVSFVLSAITSVLLIAFRIWAWYKEATKDGKITKEEIDEAIDIINEEKPKK